MSEDSRPSIGQLQDVQRFMTPQPWKANPVEDFSDSIPRITFEIDGCTENLASFESRGHANVDTDGVVALRNAAPMLLEIAAAALAYRDSECDGQRCSHPAHMSPCAILKTYDALDAALAKVRR